MNRILLKFRIFLIFIFTLITHHLNAQQRPNIVVFLVDDMGWMDTSVPFGDSVMALNKRYHTPNMERLAKEGMKFTSAYAAPVCTPSRVSLLSGMNAARHMVTNWTSLARDTPSDFDSPENPLLTPKWNINGLSPTRGIPNTAVATPLPALLKNSGYYTIHVGKAHFASWGTPGASPYNMGYLVNIAGNVAGQPQSYLGEENYGNLPGKTGFDAVQNMTEYYGTNTFLTEALTLEALKTLEQPIKTKQPFFLYMAHYAVHLPMYADPRFVDEYLKKGLDSGQAKYASMIEGMDKSLGDLMDYLKKKNVDQNTIIIFMSDNGGQSISPAKGGKLHEHNLPLREGKGSVYEGGIREPMIVKWPNVVKPGSKTATPVIIEDFFPSILEIAGIKNPSLMQTVDGKSFVSLLKGQPNADPNRIFTWHYPNKWKVKELKQIDYMSAIRQGDWKLVYDMKTQKLELYNLKTDIGEMHDVAAQNKEKVKQLAKLLSDRFRSYGTLLPTYKATGKAVPMPDELAK
jgi:arylsulfatase A-like enzyme